jgi:hypothetical protein
VVAAVAACACRLCLNSFGEITVMKGANSNSVRWRNSVPLGTRGNNKLPYTLTLNRDFTVTGEALWPLLWCCVCHMLDDLPAWTAHLMYQENCGPSPGQALHWRMQLFLPDVPDPSKSVLIHVHCYCSSHSCSL